MEKTKSKIHYGWAIVFVGFVIMWFVICSVSNCWGLFVVPVTETFGVSRTAFSLTSTCYSVAGMIFSALAGQIYGKFTIRKVMLVSSVILPVAYACYGLAPSITYFYIIGFICGLTGNALSLIAISSLCANWFNEKRGTAIAIAATGSGIGGVVMSPVIGALNSSVGWRKTYIILAVLMAVTVIPSVFFLVKDRPADKGMEPYGGYPQGGARARADSGLTLAEAMKKPYFYMLVLIFFFIGASCFGVMGQTAAYVTDSGYEYSFASVVASIVTGSLAVGKIVMGIVFDKIGAEKAAIISLLAFVAAFILYGFAQNVVLLLIGVGIIGFGLSFGTVAYSILTQDLFGKKDYANIYGKMTVFSALGMALVSPVMSAVYDATGSYGIAWKGLCALCVISICLVKAAFSIKSKEK